MPDPKDSSDDEADLEDSPSTRPLAATTAQDPAPEHRPELLRERIRGLRMLLGLLILQGLAALLGATRSAPRGAGSNAVITLHLALWFTAQLALLALIVIGLRWLRRRRLGPLPSTRLRRRSDVLLHLNAGLGGAVALLGFGPAILSGQATPLAWAITTTGAVLLALGLRAALLYVTRA